VALVWACAPNANVAPSTQASVEMMIERFMLYSCK
jgi:hypothetical protein